MIFYPAIDLKGGKVVRLYQGDMSRATIFSDDPAAQAELFAAAGCEWIHIVDLDKASAGKAGSASAVNEAALKRIIRAAPGVKLQLGGGIRRLADVGSALASGVSRVVLGTMAVESPQTVAEACELYPSKIAVALDCINGVVASEGWLRKSALSAASLAAEFADVGLAALLYTEISRDGTLKGVSPEAARLASATELPVIVSGGVASLAELAALKRRRVFAGVIVGRALYEAKFTAEAALAALSA